MPTTNKQVTPAWSKIAESTDLDIQASWDNPVVIEFAATLTDVAPVVNGHTFAREEVVTREKLGTGFVWAKLSAAFPLAVNVVVSTSIAGVQTSASSTSIVPASDATFKLAASENHIGEVSGKLSTSTVTFSRPADTTAYAALDVVGPAVAAVLNFANAARINAGSGYVAKVRLMTNQSTNTARFRLHLYHTAPVVIADNAQMTLLWANLANRVGHIDFDACATEGTGSDAASTRNITDHPAFVCATGLTTLYGVLETRDAFTPASGQQFGIELTLEQY